ncbi:MAG: ribonuclease H family protein [Bacteroidales bacterium]|nr:ribonuclease H family protein [Bacteroidales bacterium]
MRIQRKFYVVWHGRETGIYRDWASCKAQIEGVEQAKYKSFPSLEEAEQAYRSGWSAPKRPTGNRPTGEAYAVDAACSGNPGKMEYRGVFLPSGEQIFHQGPFEYGTNNVGEFLAIVHALALQVNKSTHYPIYTDSANAITWIRKKHCNTKLERNSRNEPLFELIERAEAWLATHKWDIPILKWETSLWGEIPADFGRK